MVLPTGPDMALERLERLKDALGDNYPSGDAVGIAEWIAEGLRCLKLSQDNLATLLGVTPNTVSGWLTGKNKLELSVGRAYQLAAILNVDVAEVLSYWTGEYHGKPY
jgi:DNA-binding XRE family transcriptional regulator